MKKQKLMIGILIIMVLMVGLIVTQSGFAAEAEKYTFYFVSHIGPADANMKWLTTAIEDFQKRYSEVEVRYIATETFSIKQQVEDIDIAIAAGADGLIVPITDATALEGPLRKAIEQGIPVIAVNIPDFRPSPEKIPYLTYIGGDEYLVGVKLGQNVIQAWKDGRIPKPTGVVVPIHHVGHVGLEWRAQGMVDAMKEIGVPVEKLAIGDEPTKAKEIMTAYFSVHPEDNVIFCVAAWTAPWAYEVASQLNLYPDVDTKGVTILCVDASPVALEGIIQGKLLATHSQGFYLQGYLPAEWLYFYLRFGYTPPPEIITGPIVIDETNVEQWEKGVMEVFGEKTYNELVLW